MCVSVSAASPSNISRAFDKVIDEIVPEPPGGAHRDPSAAIKLLGGAISRHLSRLSRMKPADLRRDRERKFAGMGNSFLSYAPESKA